MATTAAELMTLRAGSPLRPPTWMWDFARLYRDLPPAVRRADPDDKYLHGAIQLQEFVKNGPSEATSAQMLLASGPAGDAFAFWHTSGQASLAVPRRKLEGSTGEEEEQPVQGDRGPTSPLALARAELEALILANKSPETISKVTGLSPEAVVWYEKWFFDVRDRLKRPGWISANVIGPLHYGAPSMLLPALIRAYGFYTKSARVVRTVVGTFDAHTSKASAKNDPVAFFRTDADAASGLKAALAARLLPLNAKTYARVIELHHEAMDVNARAKTDTGSEAEAKYRSALGQLTGGLAWEYNQAPTNLAESRGPRLVTADAPGGPS